jgi:hypothetical protein
MLHLTISCPLIHHWRVLLNRMIGNIITSGLYSDSEKIHLVCWDNNNLGELEERLRSLGKFSIHKCISNSFLGLEQIKLMRSIAKNSIIQGQETYLLWSGLKSVNYSFAKDGMRFICNSDWALLLEYAMIEKYRSCLSLLDSKQFDVVGVGWVPSSPVWKSPFGSFPSFWVSGSYYASLPEPPADQEALIKLTKFDPNYQPFSGKRLISPRYGVWIEHYIGMNDPRFFDVHRAYPLGEHPAWHYHNPYPPENYDHTYFNPG